LHAKQCIFIAPEPFQSSTNVAQPQNVHTVGSAARSSNFFLRRAAIAGQTVPNPSALTQESWHSFGVLLQFVSMFLFLKSVELFK
jgi:hypothetical protein